MTGRGVHAGRQQLRRGEDHRVAFLGVTELAEEAPTDVPFIGRDARDVFLSRWELLHEVGVLVVQRPPHLVSVLLIDAEDDGLGVAVGLLEEVAEVPGDCVRASLKRYAARPLEVLGVVKGIWDLPAMGILLPLVRPPAGGVVGGQDAVDAIGSEEAVLDALLEAVGVERVAEVQVGIAVILAERVAVMPSW